MPMLRDLEDNSYKVCLHRTKQEIGLIDYLGDHCFENSEKIIFYINNEHTGKGYATEALKLLTDKLYKDGITKVYLQVYADSIASVKIAEKFGGKLMAQQSSKTAFLYECNLKEIKKDNKR